MDAAPWSDVDGDSLINDLLEINSDERQANRMDGLFLSIIVSAN